MTKFFRIFSLLLSIAVLASLSVYSVFGQEASGNPTMDQDPGDSDQQVHWVRYNSEAWRL